MKTDNHGRKIPSVASHDKPMKRFEEHVDRDRLLQFLDQSNNDRLETLFLLMQDPAYAACSFSLLCRKAKVTLHELQELYSNGMRQIALLEMSNRLPNLMLDVTEDAKSRMETCPRCDGFGCVTYKDTTRDCPMCKGNKELRRPGDKQARDLIFESAKLTKQVTPLVAIQQNFNNNQGDHHMEALLKKTRSIVLEPAHIDIKEDSE